MRGGWYVLLVVALVVAGAVAVVVVQRADEDGAATAVPTLEEVKTGVGRVEVLKCDGSPVTFGGHEATGTGFLIGSQVVMSAEHGMWVAQDEPACKMRVRFGVETYPVTNVRVWGEPAHEDMYERRGVDLATLTLARPVEDRHVFQLASAGAPKGAAVTTAGYPLGGPLKVSRGSVYRNLPNDYGVPAVATDLDIQGGNSGGPIFTDRGEVVSVVSRIVVSGSLTADKSSKSGGIDLPRWWGPDVLADLCRVYGADEIAQCEEEKGAPTAKRSVVLLPRKR
jgi:hypothetical protein